ncbi:MerC domain-containing protein [Sphingomonas changnyeongensis]|uniref:MerC domain-containing protein n=1 Tax=Sphingomonas changnyeongensis TaxID=2698679 RepID=UPI00191C121A|nr:MerC domain-containing protein [Sphingomonas changnyeongensis]
MIVRLPATATLDRWAIGLSGLCVVHCVTSVLFVTFLATTGGALLSHHFHEIGLGVAILIGVVALVRGAIDHGYTLPSAIGGLGLGVMAGALTLGHQGDEVLVTLFGVALLALGHDLNRRAAR